MAHRILFVDIGDSSQAPMAAGFARALGLEADSTGTMPGRTLSEGAVAVMNEKGIDITADAAQHVEFKELPRYERVIALGSGVHDTHPDLPLTETWRVEDPANQTLEVYRRVRDHLEVLVGKLAKEIHEWDPSMQAP